MRACLDEATARGPLPAPWLRGIEVRTWGGGAERRIDTEYEPPPGEKPEWVGRLEQPPPRRDRRNRRGVVGLQRAATA